MSSATAPRTLRMSAADLKNRLESGQRTTFLDVRAPTAWETSNIRIRGDIRVPPDQFPTDAPWPKDLLTVAY